MLNVNRSPFFIRFQDDRDRLTRISKITTKKLFGALESRFPYNESNSRDTG